MGTILIHRIIFRLIQAWWRMGLQPITCEPCGDDKSPAAALDGGVRAFLFLRETFCELKRDGKVALSA
jgi:hypothetical protein